MTVYDAQAVIALLVGEPAGPEVAAMMRDRESIQVVSALSVAEVLDLLVRRMGNRVEAADERVGWLIAGGLEVVVVDEETGRLAGILRARHWDRDRRPVSLADCVVLATGMTRHEPVATADSALRAAARAEGHPVVALPDSRGGRSA